VTLLCYRIVTKDSELVDIQRVDAGGIAKNCISSVIRGGVDTALGGKGKQNTVRDTP
jgi:hypothetical protein